MLLLVPTAREARALFDEGRSPRCEDPESLEVGGRPVRAALVGFGPAASGALAALSLARERPRRCLLVGTCGTLDAARLPVGGVCSGDSTVFADLGVERDGAWRGPKALGLEQAPAVAARPAISEELALDPHPAVADLPHGGLLTVAQASGSRSFAQQRASRYPGALAEDMESFAVALAAARLCVPCSVVRAASNEAGEPDRARWDLPAALASLRAWLLQARL
jgi:futalosine hydrolase